jgi:hypothetical protein
MKITVRRILRLTFVTLLAVLALSTAAQSQTYKDFSYANLLGQAIDKQQKDKIDEGKAALELIAAGNETIYAGEVTANLKRSYQSIEAANIIRLLPEMRSNLITRGEDFDRLNAALMPLLKFCWLEKRVALILFKSEVPVIVLSYPNALIVSTRAMSLLNNAELEAVAAHEICHLIGHNYFREASDKNDKRALRLIELFCDAGAAAIISAKGKDPSKLISGYYKMEAVLELEFGEDGRKGKHPTIETRKRLNDELCRRFNPVAAK